MRFKAPRLSQPGLNWASDMEHASNPGTSQEVLCLLKEKYENHRSQAKPILSRIAQNPNASLILLEELSASYPEYVAVNAAVKTALFTDLDWVIESLSLQCIKLLQAGTEIPLLRLRHEKEFGYQTDNDAADDELEF